MPKKALSVTLADDNLLWLKGRVLGGANRSLSDAIDAIVTAARTGGLGATPARSVVGTVDIAADDENLEKAEAYVRSVFERSIGAPFLVKESAEGATKVGKRPHARARSRG
jgi:hypothetical protein